MKSICLSVILFAGTSVAAGNSRPVDFNTRVIPVLTKAGCNAAACHGAAAGRGGFKLSLFGGDPAADYDQIVHQLEGRRINYVAPEHSLLLAKPTGQVDHGGGLRLDKDGRDAEAIVSWIRAGAVRSPIRRLVALRVQPDEIVASHVGSQRQFHALAVFDDGSQNDVTNLALYTPDDPSAINADSAGKLTILRRGRHTVAVRFLSDVQTVQITVPLTDTAPDLSQSPRYNWIDGEILKTLEMLRLPPAPQADDAALLRRVHLDLTGRLPTPEALRRYLADDDVGKFEKLVDRLLQSPEMSDYWTYKFATLLRIRTEPNDEQGTIAFHAWLRDQISHGTPLDRMVIEMITADGDAHQNGPVNFYRVASDARAQAEFFSEALMGVRLRCANCHNHPLDRWTQDDYHGLAAVFATLDRGRIVRALASGTVIHPGTGEPAARRIPGLRDLDSVSDPRQALAAWLTRPNNPYFAKALVNRIWKSLMGRGLIEPSDDLRATNPATHPELLGRLAADFVKHNYNLRHVIRLIVTSAAYARSSHSSEISHGDDRFYSHALIRPLEAEVLADALADVTGVAEPYGNQPLGTRAVSLINSRVESLTLDVLGRCSREASCDARPTEQAGLAAKLHFINGPLINQKITAPEGRLSQSIETQTTITMLVEQFYLRALGRMPSDEERTFWREELDAGGNLTERRERLEDFLWSLLTCSEFSTNH